MPTREHYSSDDEYVTRRELSLTLQPLLDKQAELIEVMTNFGKDLRELLQLAAKHEGALEANQSKTDTRRFVLTLMAMILGGVIAALVGHGL